MIIKKSKIFNNLWHVYRIDKINTHYYDNENCSNDNFKNDVNEFDNQNFFEITNANFIQSIIQKNMSISDDLDDNINDLVYVCQRCNEFFNSNNKLYQHFK